MFRILRILRYLVEGVATIAGVAVVLALLLAWRLSAHPVSSDILTPYIEAGIENIVPDSTVHLDSTLLTWSDADRAILVHADNIKVDDADGFEIAAVPSFDAKISALGLIFGQFMPTDLDIDHPQIRLERNAAGQFVFGGMAVNGGNASPDPSRGIAAVVGKLVKHLSRAALMHRLSVTRAVFDIHDQTTGKHWSVSMPEISVERSLLGAHDHHLEYGALDGRLTVEVTQMEAVASVDVRYAYDPGKQLHTLSAVFTGLTPAFIAGGHPETLGLGSLAMIDMPLSGKAELTFDKTLSLAAIETQIHGGEGHVTYPDFWDQPLFVKSIDINAAYDGLERKIKISNTHADLGGPTLDLAVDGTPSLLQGKGVNFAATLKVDNVPMNRYSELWPKPLLPDPRYWLEANLRDGLFTHAEIALKGVFSVEDLANTSITEGGGKIAATGARVIYLDGMPPAENVDAEAIFDLKTMTVQVKSGGIGKIRLSPFAVKINGLAEVDQDIDIPLQVSGPIPDILRLLDHEPLKYARALGLSPDDISGKISGEADFRFPLLKTLLTKDLNLHATANATDLASTKLVPGIPIDQGNLKMTLDMAGFDLAGQADLGKAPFQITWRENFDHAPDQPVRHATVTGAVRDDQWNNFGITALAGTKGAINVTLEMTKPAKDKMNLSGTLDMTPAAVEIDMLDWKKPANLPATLKFTATADDGKPVAVSSIALHGARIQADGDAMLSSDMTQLLSLNLDPLIVGRTNAKMHFSQTFGPDGALRFEAKGAALDVSGLRGGNEPDKADPRPKEYHLQVDKLYTGPNGFISNAKGSASRDGQGWSAIDLHGLADGDTLLGIDLTPQPDGHRTFTIACANFGKAMKGLGFTDTIKGGKLSVTGASTVVDPRIITGTARISDFTIQKLPVLALLLNATSPFGFSGILTDSADFSKFKGDFRWQGDLLTLTKAHAAGSAVGINIDGKIDMNSGTADLQGTLVPFSVVNSFLNYIPILGDLLTGGENQGVLAIAYTINGTLGDPKISVNPISLLTPGFIRNLFFGDDTSDDNP